MKAGPLFVKVKESIKAQIHSGALKPHDRIPSENELVKSMSISRMTANRALRELTQEGLIHRVAGVGRFVADHTSRGHLIEVRNIADEIRERNHHHRAEVLLLESVPADEALAAWLQVPFGRALFHSLILHREEGRPLQLEDRYVHPTIAPDYLAQDFSQKTPHQHLMEVAPLQEAEHQVQAEQPDAETRARLEMADHEPCLVLYRRTWASGLLASAVRLQHPGTRFVLAETFKHPWKKDATGPSLARVHPETKLER